MPLQENYKNLYIDDIYTIHPKLGSFCNFKKQSYQVGQLVRKLFPNIGRCKISVGGKRVWVYKNLGKRNFTASAFAGIPNILSDLQNFNSAPQIHRNEVNNAGNN